MREMGEILLQCLEDRFANTFSTEPAVEIDECLFIPIPALEVVFINTPPLLYKCNNELVYCQLCIYTYKYTTSVTL